MNDDKKIGVEEVSTEQVISGETTRNVLDKQLIRWAKRGDTTPSVLNVEKLQFRNLTPVTVVAFDDGKIGQSIEVYGDGQTTVASNTKIIRATGITSLLPAGSVTTFTRLEDNAWHEHTGAGGGGGGGGVTSFAGRGGVVVPVATDYTPAFIGAIPTSEKAAASGVATLDGASKVPALQLGTGTADATTFLRGDKTWQVISGGSFTYFDPDKPPGSPSALDDEFDGAVIDAKWTQVNWGGIGAYNVNNTKPSSLWVKPGVGSGATFRGLVQAIPAGNFTIVACINVIAGLAGVLLTNDTTGAAGSFISALIYLSAGLYKRAGYIHTNWGAAFSSQPVADAPFSQNAYVRWRRVSTTYSAGWSVDGRTWSDIVVAPGITPTHFGLFGQGTTAEVELSFDWFRYSTSGTALFGALRTVSGS